MLNLDDLLWWRMPKDIARAWFHLIQSVHAFRRFFAYWRTGLKTRTLTHDVWWYTRVISHSRQYYPVLDGVEKNLLEIDKSWNILRKYIILTLPLVFLCSKDGYVLLFYIGCNLHKILLYSVNITSRIILQYTAICKWSNR